MNPHAALRVAPARWAFARFPAPHRVDSKKTGSQEQVWRRAQPCRRVDSLEGTSDLGTVAASPARRDASVHARTHHTTGELAPPHAQTHPRVRRAVPTSRQRSTTAVSQALVG